MSTHLEEPAFDPIAVVRRRFWSLLLPLVAGGVVGILLVLLLPREYVASATLAVMTMPVVIVATEESLRAIPPGLREASLALGASNLETLWRVVLPQALPGILTGGILAIGRAAGEVAPILFTGCAYFLPRLPITHVLGIPVINPMDQFMELSYHIFIMATQSTNAVVTRPIQYGTTLVLVGLTFLLNLAAIVTRNRFRRVRASTSTTERMGSPSLAMRTLPKQDFNLEYSSGRRGIRFSFRKSGPYDARRTGVRSPLRAVSRRHGAVTAKIGCRDAICLHQ